MDADQRASIRTLALLLITLAVLGGLLWFVLPELVATTAAVFAPGLGLKQAAIIAFGLTVLVFLVFAIAAGDGLLGELQFMLGGFFGFFTILWLMLAWVF